MDSFALEGTANVLVVDSSVAIVASWLIPITFVKNVNFNSVA